MDTSDVREVAGRRRRRVHSDEFKADAVAAAAQPGMSMSAVALSLGINANLLRRWMRDAEISTVRTSRSGPSAPLPATFVALKLPEPEPVTASSDIRVELRRGATAITVTWPTAAAVECATWMRELLR